MANGPSFFNLPEFLAGKDCKTYPPPSCVTESAAKTWWRGNAIYSHSEDTLGTPQKS